MLIRFWLSNFLVQFARGVSRRRRSRPQRLRVRRGHQLARGGEPLEDRTLLAASLIFSADVNTPRNLTLALSGTDVQIVDSSDSSNVLASESLVNLTSGVQISGSGYDINLTIDSSLPIIPGGIQFNGGSGNNVLSGPVSNTTWFLTGANSGNLASGVLAVQFTDVENLTGGAGATDDFIVTPTGTLSGRIQGYENDTDSVTVQLQANSVAQTMAAVAGTSTTSGTVTRNSVAAVSYVGVKAPVELSVIATGQADSIELQRGAAARTLDIRSTNPVATFGTVNVTLRAGVIAGLDMGAGSDSVTIGASALDAALEGGEITVDGGSGTNSITSHHSCRARDGGHPGLSPGRSRRHVPPGGDHLPRQPHPPGTGRIRSTHSPADWR